MVSDGYIVVMIFYSHFCGKCFLFLYMSKSFGGRFFDASLSSFATSFEKLKTVLLNGSLTCFLSALVHCWFELHSTMHQLSISILLSSSNVGGCLYVVMETSFPRAGVGMATKVRCYGNQFSRARGSWHGNQSSRARELLWKLIFPARGSCYGNLWLSTCFVMAFSRVAVFGDVIYKLKYQFK